jgi:DUF2891 family protein
LLVDAEQRGPRDLVAACRAAALAWFADDRDPARWEPSGHDFLSPALTEADLMRRVLSPRDFATWFDAFLPGLAQGKASNLLEPAQVRDPTDGHQGHLYGLNRQPRSSLPGTVEPGEGSEDCEEPAACCVNVDMLNAVAATVGAIGYSEHGARLSNTHNNRQNRRRRQAAVVVMRVAQHRILKLGAGRSPWIGRASPYPDFGPTGIIVNCFANPMVESFRGYRYHPRIRSEKLGKSEPGLSTPFFQRIGFGQAQPRCAGWCFLPWRGYDELPGGVYRMG